MIPFRHLWGRVALERHLLAAAVRRTASQEKIQRLWRRIRFWTLAGCTRRTVQAAMARKAVEVRPLRLPIRSIWLLRTTPRSAKVIAKGVPGTDHASFC